MANSTKGRKSQKQQGAHQPRSASSRSGASSQQQQQSKSTPFAHLQGSSTHGAPHSSSASLHQAPIHSPTLPGCIIRLGHQYRRNLITGSNARCIALLDALRETIMNWYQGGNVQQQQDDHSSPTSQSSSSSHYSQHHSHHHSGSKSLARDFLKKLEPMIDYLTQCRPLSISMGNALNYLKMQIGHLSPTLSEKEQREEIISVIDAFIHENIELATQTIASKASERIRDGDVIMTYARSQSVEKAIMMAHEHKKQFRVVVVDSAPKYEGKELMRRLSNTGIQCTYVLINAVSLMCREVTKVMVGAHAMFSNGVLMSRVGTASVAMVANGYNIPVLVCCETYKFSKKTQLKAITKNEVADPRELISNDTFSDWNKKQSLDVLNLVYDITPLEFIDMVITELGCLPPTSIPVILREQNILK